jgi:uncharacterized protein YegJ (DUF2314 family)
MYKLLNAIEQNKKYPETFEIPSKSEIENVKLNTFVKLWFEESGKIPERMWVLVTEIDGDNFRGVLRNQPGNLKTVKYNDELRFKAHNILSIP